MHRFVLALALATLAYSCSANDSKTSKTGAGGGSAAGGGVGATSGSGGGVQLDSGSNPCPNECSPDLKSVLSCNGNVIDTCIEGMACAFGVCTGNPCEAAQQSGSTYGCDFWAVKTDVIPQISGACFAAFVANTWSDPVHIKVERDGAELPVSAFKIPKGQGQQLTYQQYDPAVGLPPGEVAILFLSRGPGFLVPDCPVPAALAVESGVLGTGIGSAFHITTDKPIVAYSILPYGGGGAAMTSASLLFPTGAWGTNYLAINAYPKSTFNNNNGLPSLAVVAKDDATEVTILPKAAVVAGPGVPGAPQGVPMTVTLNRGQYLQVTQDAELSGSPVVSNKPVAFFGASSCMNVPIGEAACDTAHQQIPPIKALGNAYVGANHKHRTATIESEPWRIMGAVDGTNLTWIPSAPPGAPTTLSSGQIVEFSTSEHFYVSSQDGDHPFYLSSYMTGGEKYGGTGDPEWVSVVPTEQFLKNYVLFTDPTYSDTSLVVVRARGTDGNFADVNLDCAGIIGGWQPIGDFEWTNVDLVVGNFQNVGACSNGRRTMDSTAPFGVTVWGWGSIPGFPGVSVYTQYVSYAYPAGAGVKPINQVEIPIPK